MSKRQSPFPETQWSLLRRAAGGGDAERRQSLEEFLRLYQAALHRFLVAGMRIAPDLAQDILQEFFVSKVLTYNLLAAADPSRGKFRNFLVKSLRNHTLSELRRVKERASLEEQTEDLSEFASPEVSLDDLLQSLWAQQVLCLAVDAFEQDCQARGRDDIWEVFRLRLADPALRGTEPIGYEDLIERLRIETPRKAINLLTTGVRMFRRHLETVVASYAKPGADLGEELGELKRIVYGSGMNLLWGLPEDR